MPSVAQEAAFVNAIRAAFFHYISTWGEAELAVEAPGRPVAPSGGQGTVEVALAAVVGHELGHVDCQHGIKQCLLQIALGAVTRDDKWQKALASLIFGRRSQEDEFQADKCGMRYMLLTGYEPDGALRLQQKFVELFGAGAGVNSYFSTHPPGPMRVAKLRAALPEILLR